MESRKKLRLFFIMKLRKIDIKTEQNQLYSAFYNCMDKVKGKAFFENFANEKIKHSMQVVGAGNYLLKNEAYFHNQSEEVLKLGKLVCLFHDIGRFKEIYLLSQDSNKRYNHGHFSYEILKNLGYSDLRLLLPVKRHGELADALDKDEEYQHMPDGVAKGETQKLYELVKDADKIANLYLIKYDNRIFKDLFFENLTDKDKYAPISEKVMQAVKEHTLVKSGDDKSFSDRVIQILCFVFEIYYHSSYEFTLRHKLFDNLCEYLLEYSPDKAQAQYVCNHIQNYLQSKVL